MKAGLGKRKLENGKSIGGKGRLPDRMIDRMQKYYGLVIRQNANNRKGMINDIKAGLYHIASSDQTPQHSRCPKGKYSWCGWQWDRASKATKYKHRSALPLATVDAVVPIYTDLSAKSLLSHCLDAYTQNTNETLNHLIWTRCPKKTYQGNTSVELSTASAVCHFNDGACSIARVLQCLSIHPGTNCNKAIAQINTK